MSLCLNLRQVRESRGLNQKDLATAMSVGQSAVSQWETGESKPTYKNLIKLTEILECTITDLVSTELKTSA